MTAEGICSVALGDLPRDAAERLDYDDDKATTVNPPGSRYETTPRSHILIRVVVWL